jgi:diketogulonate reductase-like aldo/keto reductase
LNRYEETRAALLDLLRTLGVDPVSLYKVGVPLVGQGFTQDDILNVLFALSREGVIEFLPGNSLMVLKT